jgi:L-lactate dehydrogenase complex protein LldE
MDHQTPAVPTPSSPMTVALFVTCLTDQFYPRVGIAVTKILEHFGCRVVFPAAQTCCGQPFFNNGFHHEARELAKRLIAALEPFDYVITPSGSCCAMVRQHFPTLFEGDHAWEHGVARVAARTFEFAEFLQRVLHVDVSTLSLPESRSMTSHECCHMRGLGVGDPSLTLLRQIGNVELRPLERAEQCCGFGGTFAVKYSAISGAIVQDKVHCVSNTGARTLVCNDAGCTMNISGYCHRTGVDVKVAHLAEVLAEAMGLEIDRW